MFKSTLKVFKSLSRNPKPWIHSKQHNSVALQPKIQPIPYTKIFFASEHMFPNYNVPHIENQMKNRRIITNDTDTPSNILERTINNLCNIETTHFDTNFENLNNFKYRISNYVENKSLAFGTPLLTNLGQSSMPSLAPMACTVLKLPSNDKNMTHNNIIDTVMPSAIKGQGIGFDLSSFENPVQQFHKLNDVLLELDKSCVRTVAGMATLSSLHEKIHDFIKCKRDANFKFGRFNISVKMSDNCVDNTELINNISDCIHFCGEPGILFNDRLEYDNPIEFLPYLSTAPCAELAMSEGDGCHFAYINLNNIIKNNSIDFSLLETMVRDIVRLLDNAVEISYTLGQDMVIYKRRIGIGLCGFHDMLLNLEIPYTNKNACKIAEKIQSFINYRSKIESCLLAKHRGTFKYYNISKYTSDNDWLRRHEYKDLPENTNDWQYYYDLIDKYGIRNSTTTALPPSGNSSLIIDASQSIEPYFNLLNMFNPNDINIHLKKYLKKKYNSQNYKKIKQNILDSKQGVFQSNLLPFKELEDLLATARYIQPEKHIDIVSSFQKHIDDSISKTINIPNNYDKNNIKELIRYAYTNGLKGITLFRDGCLDERQ